MQSWAILAIIGGLASNAQHLSSKYSLKNNEDATAYGWFFSFFRMIVMLFLLPFFFSFNFSFQAVFVLISLCLGEFMGMYLFVKMHSHSHLSISALFARMKLVWVPIIAFVIMGERLSLFAYLGIALVTLGVVVVMARDGFTLDKGMKYGLMFSIVSAFNAILIKQVTQFSTVPVMLFCISFTSFILLPIFMKSAIVRIKNNIWINLKFKLLAVAFDCVAMVSFALAVRSGPVGNVTSLYQSMMVVSVVAGIVILKERDHILYKIIGVGLTIIGILLLTR